MHPAANPFGVEDHLRTVSRHRREIAAIFLGCLLVGGGGSFLFTRLYQAHARILVTRTRQDPQIAAGPTSRSETHGAPDAVELNTQTHIFTSPIVAARVVERLGADQVLASMHRRFDWLRGLPELVMFSPPSIWIFSLLGVDLVPPTPEQIAIGKVEGNLRADPVPQSAIFVASFTAADDAFAARALNTAVGAYLEHYLELQQQGEAAAFFAREAERIRAELERAVARLQAFKRDWGIIAIDVQKQKLLGRISDVESALRKVQIDALESTVRITELRQQLADRSQAVPLTSIASRNPTRDELERKLSQLELESAAYQPDSPAAEAIRAQMAAVRQQIGAERPTVNQQTVGKDATYQSLETALARELGRQKALEARLALRDQLTELRGRLATLDEKEARLNELLLDVQLKKDSYKLVLQKREESRINTMLDQSRFANARLIEPARPPERALWPRRGRNIALSAVVGLLVGLAWAYLAEYFRRSLTTEAELRRLLERPVWASFPDGGDSALSARWLRESFLEELHHDGLHRLLITSALPGEGKSMIARTLASFLSAQGHRVLLVDRAPRTEADQPEPAGVPNLSRLGAGAQGGQPDVDFLTGPAAPIFESFEIVLIDGAALEGWPEGIRLASSLDGVCLVAQAERTPADVVRSAAAAIGGAGGRLRGVVLNRRRDVLPAWFQERFFAAPSPALSPDGVP